MNCFGTMVRVEERKRCCCNCRHDIRTKNNEGRIVCHCEIDGHYIGYVKTFTGWCRRWASDAKYWEEKGVKVDG